MATPPNTPHSDASLFFCFKASSSAASALSLSLHQNDNMVPGPPHQPDSQSDRPGSLELAGGAQPLFNFKPLPNAVCPSARVRRLGSWLASGAFSFFPRPARGWCRAAWLLPH
ncbi:hypothetical protein M758_7G167000 [Ceratodon purpureus]|nr:hypothetical protein M758_7G167000 [Ceratodon purpureus]